MGYISERVATITEAITLKRVLAVSAISTVVTAVIHLIPYLSRERDPVLLGTASWAWGIMAGLAFLIFFLIEYATRLRLSLVPRIKPYFTQAENGIVETPEKAFLIGDNGKIVSEKEHKAVYVRIHVKTLSLRPIKDCFAYLTTIEKRQKNGEFSIIPLSFPLLLTPEGMTVYPFPLPIDFLTCDEVSSKLRFTAKWPLTIRSVLEDYVTYRFTITVTENETINTVRVEVDWNGKWDRITAREIGNS